METNQSFLLGIKDAKLRSFFSDLLIGILRVSKESTDATEKDERYMESLKAWVTGVIRFVMLQKLLYTLAIQYDYSPTISRFRVTVRTSEFIIQIHRVRSKNQSPLKKEQVALFDEPLFPIPESSRAILIIGVFYSLNRKKSHREKYGIPAMVQAAIVDISTGEYAFTPVSLETMLAFDPTIITEAAKPAKKANVKESINDRIQEQTKQRKRRSNE